MDESTFAVVKPKPRIVGTGLIALDVITDRANDARMTLAAGGSCGNVLAILGYLGWAAYPVARMNGDAASRLIHDDLTRWGVRCDYSRLEPHADTPIVVQRNRVNRDGQRTHSFTFKCPTCGQWLPRFRPVTRHAVHMIKAKIAKPTVFYMDRVSRGILDIADACRSMGAVMFFEPTGVGDPALFEEALELAHVVKFAHDRVDASALGAMSRLNVRLAIQTQGENGLRYLSRLENHGKHRWRHVDKTPPSRS